MASFHSSSAFISERLRLLYVGLTRARHQVILVPDSGNNQTQNAPAEAYLELDEYMIKRSMRKSNA